MRKIKIAQIGVNRYSHASEIFEAVRNLPNVFELVGYAIVEDERKTCAAKIEKSFSGVKEMTLAEILNDPSIEAVTVETDEIHLLKYAQMAAEAGKHIHMEKPGSQNLVAFDHLIETVKKRGTVLHIGYMYRYNPVIADVIARSQRGEFGHIYSVEAHMSRLDPREIREWFGSFRGGMMFYLGCHLVDLVLQILGEPTNVIPLNTRTGIDGIDTEDLGVAVLQYPNAIAMVRMGGAEVGGFDRRQLVVCGERGTVEIRPLEYYTEIDTGEYKLFTKGVETVREESGSVRTTALQSEALDRYEGMMLAFSEMVRGEKTNPYTFEYELTLFRTLMKCCGDLSV